MFMVETLWLSDSKEDKGDAYFMVLVGTDWCYQCKSGMTGRQ